jgi:hypothetical protein
MPEVKGKLPRGASGILRLQDEQITINELSGLISKKEVNLKTINIKEIKQISTETRTKPFPNLHRVLLIYTDLDIEREESFFTQDKIVLEDITKTVLDDIERRRLEREKKKEDFYKTRDLHLTHIMFNLELVDRVCQILIELHGTVDWSRVNEHQDQFLKINDERSIMEGVETEHVNTHELASFINKRYTQEIKQEAYNILQTIYEESTKVKVIPEWLKTEYYSLFIKTELLIWDMVMSKHLEKRRKTEEYNEIISNLARITNHIRSERAPEENEPLPEPSDEDIDFMVLRKKVYELHEELSNNKFRDELEPDDYNRTATDEGYLQA